MTVATPMIEVRGLGKMFTLHNQGGIRLPVLEAVDFDAAAGDCLVLAGPSGTGKSTLLRCLYGNYLATEGSIRVRAGDSWVELVGAPEQRILALRRDVIGYVSQFLRVIPRVSALDVVAEPLRMAGIDAGEARERAAAMLRRLNVPQRLWGWRPPRSRAANSNGSTSPAASSPGIPSCCWTSRPRRWIRTTARWWWR